MNETTRGIAGEPANEEVKRKANIRHWKNEPFVWIIIACVAVLLFQMLVLTGLTIYLFSQINFAAERGVAIRLTHVGLAMCFGFLFVLLAAFWAWYDVRSSDQMEFSHTKISGKSVGISAILATCGTIIIVASVLKPFYFAETGAAQNSSLQDSSAQSGPPSGITTTKPSIPGPGSP